VAGARRARLVHEGASHVHVARRGAAYCARCGRSWCGGARASRPGRAANAPLEAPSRQSARIWPRVRCSTRVRKLIDCALPILIGRSRRRFHEYHRHARVSSLRASCPVTLERIQPRQRAAAIVAAAATIQASIKAAAIAAAADSLHVSAAAAAGEVGSSAPTPATPPAAAAGAGAGATCWQTAAAQRRRTMRMGGSACHESSAGS
jgi:hypothetical protein